MSQFFCRETFYEDFLIRSHPFSTENDSSTSQNKRLVILRFLVKQSRWRGYFERLFIARSITRRYFCDRSQVRTVRSQVRTVRTERKMTQRVNFRSKTQTWLVIDRSGALASAGAVAGGFWAAFSSRVLELEPGQCFVVDRAQSTAESTQKFMWLTTGAEAFRRVLGASPECISVA